MSLSRKPLGAAGATGRFGSCPAPRFTFFFGSAVALLETTVTCPKSWARSRGLTKLDLSANENLGAAPEDLVFPRTHGGMKSLRELNLGSCDIHAVPAFVGELRSLESLDLSFGDDFQIDASARLSFRGLSSPEGRGHAKMDRGD